MCCCISCVNWNDVTWFRCDINGIFALLACYAAYIGIYRRFGTTYRSLLQCEPWNETENIGVTIEAPIDRFPETSVTTTASCVTLRARILEYGVRRLYRKNLRCVTSQKNEDLQWWAVVNTVMNLRVPWNGVNFRTTWGTRNSSSQGLCFVALTSSLI